MYSKKLCLSAKLFALGVDYVFVWCLFSHWNISLKIRREVLLRWFLEIIFWVLLWERDYSVGIGVFLQVSIYSIPQFWRNDHWKMGIGKARKRINKSSCKRGRLFCFSYIKTKRPENMAKAFIVIFHNLIINTIT